MSKARIKEIADKVGGVVALSRKLGLSRAAVSQWTRVPVDRLADVERITGVPREALRPDIFAAVARAAASGGADAADEAPDPESTSKVAA